MQSRIRTSHFGCFSESDPAKAVFNHGTLLPPGTPINNDGGVLNNYPGPILRFCLDQGTVIRHDYASRYPRRLLGHLGPERLAALAEMLEQARVLPAPEREPERVSGE